MFKWKENGKTKLLIVCGTRPEIIRLAAVMKRSREYLDTCICYTNQNYDNKKTCSSMNQQKGITAIKQPKLAAQICMS